MDQATIMFLESLDNPMVMMLLLLLAAWSLTWKGIALWRAAHNNQMKWFIAMLIINSVGILEIVYIFYFSRKKQKETIAPPSSSVQQ